MDVTVRGLYLLNILPKGPVVYSYFIYVLFVYKYILHREMRNVVRKPFPAVPCPEGVEEDAITEPRGCQKFSRCDAYHPSTESTHRTQTMSSSTPNTSKPDENASKAPEKPKSDDIPHLGVLEEDDEFEEFQCAGELQHVRIVGS